MLYFVLLMHMSVLRIIAPCLDYLSFVIDCEIMCYKCFNFGLFQNCFDSSRSFYFQMHFRISFSISTKKSAGILIGVLFNLESSLRNIAILSFPVHEHEMFFHLFRSSLVSTIFCSFQSVSFTCLLLNIFLSI